MENTFNVTLNGTEDFEMLCRIYQINPQVLLQSFVDQLSFPLYYSNPNGRERWAAFFFLKFLETDESSYQVSEEIEAHYLNKLNDAIDYSPNSEARDIEDKAGIIRTIMREWLKDTLAAGTEGL